MEQRTIHIWHDKVGNIVAWGRMPDKSPKHLGAIPLAGPDNEVITAQVSIDDLPNIYETHYIELNSKKLVLK